ncbi:efflux RND transporter periplasmic adaptor subunit [Desulfitobacterium chlororespirans]|uniref:RND family efflux transporter, MFP subunit n=1 Tax=Desulfitobacterium chlororespirans DSM 11544 TaxID=1121395 RepID=A0A1M7UQ33_9FIRM|nr:efflux RND transporter periplasmic adaptor subunit [Desulfitobacterium chlororespirans]SHN85143.1 RND family efflux transporter, MFP subunit [Desulfitobacterium chlororespirans DSM 11544]
MRSKLTGSFMSLAVILTMMLGGCTQATAVIPPEREHLVQVQEAEEGAYPVDLRYTGLTSAGELKKYSFKIPGKLTDIAVEKGALVKPGQKLAALDTAEYGLAVQASQLNVTKAEKAYTEARDNYGKLEKLHEAGALPEADLIKVKLDLDVKEATYRQAEIELEAKQIQLNDAQLYAQNEGYVVDILFRESEIVAAGYPVVVIRSPEQKVTVGLSQSDVQKVKMGDRVEITLDGQKGTGHVERLEAVPDQQTRTYTAEILITEPFPSERYYLGATAEVKFAQGEAAGIWVPLACILNDGEDYVFLVEDGRAVKRNIKLMDTQGFNVRVEGLKPGEHYVFSGMKSLKEGQKVRIQSEGTSHEQ